jgi:hypothetical protein
LDDERAADRIVKHIGTLFWCALLAGSLACVVAGFAGARNLHSETVALLRASPAAKIPPAARPRDLTRQLIGAHSFVTDDEDEAAVGDVVVKRYGDWAPPIEPATFIQHPKLALIIADCGHALPLDTKFAALSVPLTLAVDPEGGDSSDFVRALGDRHVLMTISNATFANPSTQALEALASWYATVHAEGVVTPLAGSIDGTQARRVAASLPGTSIVVDGMAEDTATVYRYARGRGLPSVTRDVVIDTVEQPRYIAFMLKQAAELSLRTGVAVAVARSRPATLDAIVAALPMFERDGIEIVPIEALAARTLTQR